MSETYVRPFDFEAARDHIYDSGGASRTALDACDDADVLAWFDQSYVGGPAQFMADGEPGSSVRDDASRTCPWGVCAGGLRSGS